MGVGMGWGYDLPQRPAVQVALWSKSSASLLIEVPLLQVPLSAVGCLTASQHLWLSVTSHLPPRDGEGAVGGRSIGSILGDLGSC